MTGNPVADFTGSTHQAGQLGKCERVFTQQGEIRRTPADGLDHKQHPADGCVRVVGLCACLENHRHECVQPLPTLTRESLIETAVPYAGQHGEYLLRVAKAKRLELFHLILGCQCVLPDIGKKRIVLLGLRSSFPMKNREE